MFGYTLVWHLNKMPINSESHLDISCLHNYVALAAVRSEIYPNKEDVFQSTFQFLGLLEKEIIF